MHFSKHRGFFWQVATTLHPGISSLDRMDQDRETSRHGMLEWSELAGCAQQVSHEKRFVMVLERNQEQLDRT
jgi:hypothetical protein